MNWYRIATDGIAMAMVFNLIAAIVWRRYPGAFSILYPLRLRLKIDASGQTVAKPKHPYMLYVIAALCLYSAASLYISGVQAPSHVFLSAYIEMLLINLGTFLCIDLYVRKKYRANLMLPGTESDPFWTTRGWLREHSLPEHGLLWPMVICPALAGVITLLVYFCTKVSMVSI